jgi:hypothetical protein
MSSTPMPQEGTFPARSHQKPPAGARAAGLGGLSGGIGPTVQADISMDPPTTKASGIPCVSTAAVTSVSLSGPGRSLWDEHTEPPLS